MQLEDYFDFQRPDDIRLKGTRVGIENVLYEYLYRSRTPEEIVSCFSSITLEQVYAAILYYLHNKESVSQYITDGLEREHEQWKQQQLNPTPTMLRLRKIRAEMEADKRKKWDENGDVEYPEPRGSLVASLKNYGRTRKEQIKINQKGIEMLRAWREEKLTEEELEAARKTWEMAKTIIDENRSRKLFS
ncbi:MULTISPECIES: DUF433 domain-containing protein [Spirulina sp. CCY15215]|uniref:DUF433 domain-containing protein n=1 Tax=Spirulina sp. CCY15215 TaxID=2767591 RepID=UPI0019504FBA|nr:DUF433 domain-containing protein [Spirulina major]